MAATTIKELRAEITGDLSKLDKALNRAEAKAQKFGRAMKGLAKGIGILFAVATAAAVGASAALIKLADSASKAGDELAKTAKRTGLAVEQLRGLKHAAELSDTNVQSLSKALLRMKASQAEVGDEIQRNQLQQRQYRLTLKTLEKQYERLNTEAEDYAEKEADLGERIAIATEQLRVAEDQIGTYSEAWRDLGITLETEEGTQKTQVQLLMELADALKGAGAESLKMDAARKVLGRGVQDLLPLFADGAEGIREMMEEEKKLAGVWTAVSAKAAEEYQDNITRLKATLRGLKDFLGIELMGVFDPLIQKATAFVAEHKEKIQGYLRDIAETTEEIMARIGDVLRRVDWEKWRQDAERAVNWISENVPVLLKGATKAIEALAKATEFSIKALEKSRRLRKKDFWMAVYFEDWIKAGRRESMRLLYGMMDEVLNAYLATLKEGEKVTEEGLRGVIGKFIEAIEKYKPELAETAEDFAKTWIESIFRDIEISFPKVQQAIETSADKVVETVKEKAKDIKESLKKAGEDIAEPPEKPAEEEAGELKIWPVGKKDVAEELRRRKRTREEWLRERAASLDVAREQARLRREARLGGIERRREERKEYREEFGEELEEFKPLRPGLPISEEELKQMMKAVSGAGEKIGDSFIQGIINAIKKGEKKLYDILKELADKFKVTEPQSPPLLDLKEMSAMGSQIVSALVEGVGSARQALSVEVGNLAGQLNTLNPAVTASPSGPTYDMKAYFDVKNEGIPIDPEVLADEFLEAIRRQLR